METDAEASGIQSWLFGFVSVTLTTIQTHRFPISFSRMGSLPMRRVRIGSVDTKSVIPLRNSTTPGYFRMREQNNPRPLAFEACLNSREIRTSVGTSPGTVQYTQLGQQSSVALLVSPQNGLLSVAVVSSPEHACVCIIRWSLALCGGATERSGAGKSARAHPLHRSVWQYMSILSPVYIYTL